MLEKKYLLITVLIVNAFFVIDSATTKRPDLTENPTTIIPGSNIKVVTPTETSGNENINNTNKSPVDSGVSTETSLEKVLAGKIIPKAPLDNVVPNEASVDNAVPSEAPVDNDVPTVAPVDNAKPTEAPVDNAAPSEPSVDNVVPNEAPADNVVPNEAPVDNAAPSEAPIENVVANEAPVDNALPSEASVDNVAPTEAPVDNVVLTESPIDNAKLTESPVDNTLPSEAPIDNAALTEAPVDNALPTDAPVDNTVSSEAPVDNAVLSNAPVDNVLPFKAPIDNVVPSEESVDNAVTKETPIDKVDNAVPTKAPVNNALPTKAPASNDMPTKAPVDNAVPTKAPANNDMSTKAPVDNALPTKAPASNDMPTEAPVDKAVATKAPVNNDVPTKAPVDNVVPTKAPVDNAVVTKAPVNNDMPTKAPVDNAVATKAPANNDMSTKAPVDNALPTNAPASNDMPTEAPVDKAVATKAPVNNDVPTKAPVDNIVPTKAPVDNAVVTKAPANNDMPTKAPVDKAVATKAPANNDMSTKAPVDNALFINEPVEITENENVPADTSIVTTNTNNKNGQDSESLFNSDIDPFAVGMDPFHSLFGDSHGINIGSPTVPTENIDSNNTNKLIEENTNTETSTPFPIIFSTEESNLNPSIPSVSTTIASDDAMSNDVSTTVQPVVMETSSSLAVEQTWTHLCSQCDTVDQTCNYPHPHDCQIFIECFRQGNGWRATPMLCGHGTFFSEQTKRCDHAYLADCKKDRCSTSNIAKYKHSMDKNCATYWKCDNKQSKATCCPEGEAYVGGYGCIADENCTAQCPNSQNTTFPDLPDNFFEFREDGTCKTNVHLDFEQITLTNESPKHNVVAVRNGMDKIVIKDGHGVFKGRSYIYVPYYNHNDFQVKQAFIQLRFLPFTREGANKQILVSTCSTNYESTGYSPSIEISIDKVHNLLVFTGVTHKRTVQFDLPYRTDQWNKVQFIYDGVNTFNATVLPETDKDDIQRKQIILEGVNEKNPLIKPTMPLRIGSCYRGAWRNDVDDFFQGEMDDIYIASCVPELD